MNPHSYFSLFYTCLLCCSLPIHSALINVSSAGVLERAITEDGIGVTLLQCNTAEIVVNNNAQDNHFDIAYHLLKQDKECCRLDNRDVFAEYPNILSYCNFIQTSNKGHGCCMRNGIMLYALIKKSLCDQSLMNSLCVDTGKYAINSEWKIVMQDACDVMQEHRKRSELQADCKPLSYSLSKRVLINEVDNLKRTLDTASWTVRPWIMCRDSIHTIFSAVVYYCRMGWRLVNI